MMKDNIQFHFTKTFWNISSTRWSTSERRLRPNVSRITWHTCCAPSSREKTPSTAPNRERNKEILVLEPDFCSAIEQISMAVTIEIVKSQLRKSAKLGLAKEIASLISLDLKTPINRMHKRRLMLKVRVAFDNTDFSEQGAIVCEKTGTKKGEYWQILEEF